MAKESSLPSSLIPHLFDRPQEQRTASPSASSQEPEEAPVPFEPSRPPPFSLRPHATSDSYRQHPTLYEPDAGHLPFGSGFSVGSSSFYASGSHYQNPPPSETNYRPIPQHPQQASSPQYPGNTSYSRLAETTLPWAEGQAGPSQIPSYASSSQPGYPQRRSVDPNYQGESPYERIRPEQESLRPPLSYERSFDGRYPYPDTQYLPLHRHPPATSASYDGPRGTPRLYPYEDDDPRPVKIQKKIGVACNFCRQRKLKCDGKKPICGNCESRGNSCHFRSEQKRRGPGKGKSSRKKTVSRRPEGSSGRRDEILPESRFRDDDGTSMPTRRSYDLASQGDSSPTTGDDEPDDQQYAETEYRESNSSQTMRRRQNPDGREGRYSRPPEEHDRQ